MAKEAEAVTQTSWSLIHSAMVLVKTHGLVGFSLGLAGHESPAAFESHAGVQLAKESQGVVTPQRLLFSKMAALLHYT